MTPELLSRYMPLFIKGTVLTIQLTIASFILGIIIGLFGAFGRLSKARIVYVPVTTYVEVIRSTPAIVQLFVVYYGLAEYGIRLPAFWAAVLALGLFSGAFFTEIFRGGILSVDQGQVEAANALGMGKRSVMSRVILPQTVLIVLPPTANMSIDLLKATALVVTIGAQDLMYQAFTAASDTYRSMDFFIIAGLIYLMLAYPLSLGAGRLEQFAKRYST